MAVAVFACGSALAFPTLYTDIDLYGQYVSTGQPLSGTFNISAGDGTGLAGYKPETQQVTSASAQFVIRDETFLDGEERFVISLSDSTWNGNAFAAFLNVDLGSTGTLLLQLSDDGEIAYTVSASKGDFILVSATLEALADKRVAVPDSGTTLALLGLGLVGVGALRRRHA